VLQRKEGGGFVVFSLRFPSLRLSCRERVTDKRMHEQEIKLGKIEIKTWLKGGEGGDE